ncbi:MAG: roadblock/LC7 domain-containing protein [Candidatus Asgardarchaeia archaeon]
MSFKIDKETREKLISLLENVANDIKLDAIAIVTRNGENIASWASKDVDPDLLSAISAAILALGVQTTEKLDKGELWDVLVRGSRGYVVMAKAGEELLLIGSGKFYSNLGLVMGILRGAAKNIGDILE